MKKMNNKGYMLVEIILAFGIAFAIMYFMMDLVINIKNKNDDLLVKTLVSTDQTIITNELMEIAKKEKENFDCSLLTIDGQTVLYDNEVITIVSDYVVIDNFDNTDKNYCLVDNSKNISIWIPLNVKQMTNENYDVVVEYRYKNNKNDDEAPICTINATAGSTTLEVTYSDDNGSISYYGWDSSYSGENNTIKTVDATGTITYYVMDAAGNKGTCTGTVKSTTKGCTSGWSYAGACYWNPCSPDYCTEYLSEFNKFTCDSGYTKLSKSYCFKAD